jgi:hypothetical protein
VRNLRPLTGKSDAIAWTNLDAEHRTAQGTRIIALDLQAVIPALLHDGPMIRAFAGQPFDALAVDVTRVESIKLELRTKVSPIALEAYLSGCRPHAQRGETKQQRLRNLHRMFPHRFASQQKLCRLAIEPVARISSSRCVN